MHCSKCSVEESHTCVGPTAWPVRRWSQQAPDDIDHEQWCVIPVSGSTLRMVHSDKLFVEHRLSPWWLPHCSLSSLLYRCRTWSMVDCQPPIVLSVEVLFDLSLVMLNHIQHTSAKVFTKNKTIFCDTNSPLQERWFPLLVITSPHALQTTPSKQPYNRPSREAGCKPKCCRSCIGSYTNLKV